MTPERIPHGTVPHTFENLYQAYAAELLKWLYWLRLSPQDAEDVAQEVWLVISEKIERLPTDASATQKELRRVATNIARTVRRRAVRNAERHVPVFPENLQGRVSQVEQFDNMAELMDAIDQLEEPLRDVFIAGKVLGFSYPEIAAMTGLKERTVWARVWNACAKVQKILRKNEKRENRGVVIAPAEIEIAPETRAAMCALWSMEGRMPQFGGPKDPPPPPIPMFANVSPVMKEAARRVTVKANQAILLLLLLLTSAATVALLLLWEPTKVDSARSGLYLPQTPISEVKDVVEVYPTQSPAAPSAQASAQAAESKTVPKTHQKLDPDVLHELEGLGLTRSGSGSE